MTETQKAQIKMWGTSLLQVINAADMAVKAAGDRYSVFSENPSVLLNIAAALIIAVVAALSKGPVEARAIDAEQKAKAEEKAFVKVATMTGNLPIPPDPRI